MVYAEMPIFEEGFLLLKSLYLSLQLNSCLLSYQVSVIKRTERFQHQIDSLRNGGKELPSCWRGSDLPTERTSQVGY